jgi:Tfp pilus assembly protein PilN
MINLLPPDHAMRIRFGRSNTALRRWIIAVIFSIVGLLIIFAGGWFYLNNQTANLQRQLDGTNQQLEAQNLSKVQKDAAEITGDIKVINQVLGSEVHFSDLIQDIGTLMPKGAVVESLTLGKINDALDLTVHTTDTAVATQVAVNLNDPANGIFSKVDIVSINCSSTNTTYKCDATFKALFSSSAQKKYQSVPQGKQT